MYHDAKAKASDDGVLDGDGSEVDGANMAGEHLSDGAEGVLGNGSEDGGTSQVPELFGFFQELSGEIFGAGDGRDVGGGGSENGGVLVGLFCLFCGSEKWLVVFSGALHYRQRDVRGGLEEKE